MDRFLLDGHEIREGLMAITHGEMHPADFDEEGMRAWLRDAWGLQGEVKTIQMGIAEGQTPQQALGTLTAGRWVRESGRRDRVHQALRGAQDKDSGDGLGDRLAVRHRLRHNRSVYLRADDRFEVGYRDSTGRQRWKGPFDTVTAAREYRDTVRGAKARGERVVPNPRLTFNGAADAWWEAQATRLRPNTQDAYGASLRHLRAEFGRRRLDQLEVGDVARFVTRMQRGAHGGPPAKVWTVRGALTVLSRVFKYAARHLAGPAVNPVAQLERGERPESEDQSMRVLSGDDLARVLACADDHCRPAFQFAAATGCRLGEVVGLRWGKVDLERGVVTIDHQLDRRGDYVPLKTRRSRRTIEIPPSLVSVLRGHRLASPASGEHGHVFCSRTGGPMDHRNLAGRMLARALGRAGLGAVEVDGKVVRPSPTFHTFRHGHASAWIHGGGSIVELSARLGHRDPSVTMRIYAHVIEDAGSSSARADRLEAMYGAAMEARVEAKDRSRAQQNPAAVVVDLPMEREKGNAAQ